MSADLTAFLCGEGPVTFRYASENGVFADFRLYPTDYYKFDLYLGASEGSRGPAAGAGDNRVAKAENERVPNDSLVAGRNVFALIKNQSQRS